MRRKTQTIPAPMKSEPVLSTLDTTQTTVADGEAALAKACKDGHDQSRSDACKQRSKKREESSEGPEGRIGRDRRGVFEVLGGIVK